MASKRILLMYISDVSGHRSAALAVEKALKMLSVNVEVMSINAFNYTNPISEKIINKIYMSVVNNVPQIWDYLYDNPDVVKSLENIKNKVHKFNSPKLKKLFERFKPDVVACTQAFPCGMVADFKKYYKSDIPLVAILTDYVPHSFWVYDTVNYYISPSDEVTTRLVAKGVSRDRIKEFGIPFDHKFNQVFNKGEILRSLGFDPEVFTILIMGGSHGLGPMKTIVSSLEKTEGNIQIIVVTGANKKLFKSLKNKTKKYKKKIRIFGFVDTINEFMSASDVIITKPGGITTAEALTKRLPMIIIKPLPGQEAKNTEYLMRKGAALKVDNLEEIHLVINSLVRHPLGLRQLTEAASRISYPQASLDIAKLLLDLNND